MYSCDNKMTDLSDGLIPPHLSANVIFFARDYGFSTFWKLSKQKDVEKSDHPPKNTEIVIYDKKHHISLNMWRNQTIQKIRHFIINMFITCISN